MIATKLAESRPSRPPRWIPARAGGCGASPVRPFFRPPRPASVVATVASLYPPRLRSRAEYTMAAAVRRGRKRGETPWQQAGLLLGAQPRSAIVTFGQRPGELGMGARTVGRCRRRRVGHSDPRCAARASVHGQLRNSVPIFAGARTTYFRPAAGTGSRKTPRSSFLVKQRSPSLSSE